MKDKVNQMFKDKLFLVMMVIGLLTAVAAVGVLTVSNTDEKGQSPYLEVPGGEIIAQDGVPETAQKEEKAEEKTASGIILTDKNTEKPTVGKVLAVNNGHEVDGKHVECCVKVNDRVIYEKYGGTEVKIDGQEYLLVPESKIMAVIE
mgnify:FL=1